MKHESSVKMGSGIPLCRMQFYSVHCTRKHFRQICQFCKLWVKAYLGEVREICGKYDHGRSATSNFMLVLRVIN